MVEIEIGRGRKRSGVVKIDECSLPIVLAHKWYIDVYGYAMTTIRHVHNVGMHRLVTNAPEGVSVDHCNGNPLDNRLDNLRLCEHKQNMRNRRPRYDNKCGLKGVTPIKGGRYMAQIGFDGKNKYLGTFGTPEEAHQAYRRAATELHGEFARLA